MFFIITAWLFFISFIFIIINYNSWSPKGLKMQYPGIRKAWNWKRKVFWPFPTGVSSVVGINKIYNHCHAWILRKFLYLLPTIGPIDWCNPFVDALVQVNSGKITIKMKKQLNFHLFNQGSLRSITYLVSSLSWIQFWTWLHLVWPKKKLAKLIKNYKQIIF